ncbi:phage tail protein, partial [Vibrio cholerae]|nr:phage tail protein [Vibrio cholerae]
MNQNLKTVVTLGGTVDSSFGKIGSVFNSSMGKATKTVKELEREQAKLTKQIKTAKLAGADVGLLTRRYQQLSTELGKATEKAEAFEEA